MTQTPALSKTSHSSPHSSILGFRKNVDLEKPLPISPWRKIAIGTWRTAGDPSVYAELELDATAALDYLERWKTHGGRRATLTHFAGKAIAEVIHRHPQINCLLRFGRLYPRSSVDVFFQVATDMKGEDLSGMTIRQADRKTIGDIIHEMEDRVRMIRGKTDPSYAKMKGLMGILPGWAVGYAIDAASFLMYALNIWSPLIGSPRDSFGSVMVTSIGSLGLDSAFVPLVPYSRVPLLLAIGAVREKPVVKNGKIEIAPIVKICATFDHRVIDGVHGSHMARTLKAIFENPGKELGEPG
jgi:pyruvate/2-oxoglutarate dehydrogenase complex dihydrolipoamide acyltransferase (E2) component